MKRKSRGGEDTHSNQNGKKVRRTGGAHKGRRARIRDAHDAAGGSGFLVSFRTGDWTAARNEVYELMGEAMEFVGDKDDAVKGAQGKDHAEKEVGSMISDLEAEIAAAKSGEKDRVDGMLKFCRTKCKGLLLVALGDQDAKFTMPIARRIFERRASGPISRRISRFTPLQKICRAREQDILDTMKAVLKDSMGQIVRDYREKKLVQFAVRFKARNMTESPREKLVPLLAQAFVDAFAQEVPSDARATPKVNLTEPDIAIICEIWHPFCGLAVLSDFRGTYRSLRLS